MSKVIRFFGNLGPKVQEEIGRRRNSSTSGLFLSKLAIRNVSRNDWSRTVSEAEKLVRYEGSFRSLRQLLSDENATAGLNLQDRINSDHPLFKAAKSLSFIDEKLLAWGLIVLLVSKATGHGMDISNQKQDTSAGVLESQRTLAEVTDMVRTSHLLHQAIINLKPSNNFGNDLSGDSDVVFGNKIAMLGGDSLLAKAFKQVATLRNHDLNQLMSSALRDLAESNFIGDRDDQNNPLPSKPQPDAKDSARDSVNNLYDLNFGDLDDNTAPLQTDGFVGNAGKEWSLRSVLGGGSLLGKGCQGALMLGGQPEPLQRLGYLLGRHLALAWEACLDLQPFQQSNLREGTQFSLVSAPVLFHLEHDATLYEEIEKGCKSVDNIDYFKVHRVVSQGPGVKMTKVLQLKHSELVTRVLHELPFTDARTSLENIVLAMQEV